MSYNKIARQLEVSVGTAFNRVKNLEERGIVKNYTIVIDPTKLGYELTAVILIQAAGKHLEDVEAEIAKATNVIAMYDITGDYDAALITKFRDRSDLNDFVKRLLANPHIKRTVTNVVLNVIKEDCLSQISEA